MSVGCRVAIVETQLVCQHDQPGSYPTSEMRSEMCFLLCSRAMRCLIRTRACLVVIRSKPFLLLQDPGPADWTTLFHPNDRRRDDIKLESPCPTMNGRAFTHESLEGVDF